MNLFAERVGVYARSCCVQVNPVSETTVRQFDMCIVYKRDMREVFRVYFTISCVTPHRAVHWIIQEYEGYVVLLMS